MRVLTVTITIVSLQTAPCASAFAQVVMDGTVGREGPLPGPGYEITEDMGAVRGNNLFHSFKTFSIHQGESATFSGPDDLANVISRVTGSEVSTIDGQLISEVPNADFWFINPAGVIFGPHAEVHVPAAFHVSTADELRFADGARFAASDPQASTLTSARPEAFGFLGSQPGKIRLSGTYLSFEESQTVSLIGGDIDMDGGDIEMIETVEGSPLFLDPANAGTAGVHWNLIGVRGPGKVTLTASGADVSKVESFADITMKSSGVRVFNTANVHVEADHVALESSDIATTVMNGGQGGDIRVRARSMEVLDISRVTNTAGEGNGGAVIIDVDKLLVSGRIVVPGRDGYIRSSIAAHAQNVGNAGSVMVQAEEVELRDGGVISVATFGSQDAGTVTVKADRVFISGDGAISATTQEEATGDGGAVVVRAREVLLEDRGFITARSLGTGRAGTIAILDVEQLRLTNKSRIAAEAGAADGGQIEIEGADLVHLRDSAITTTVAGRVGDAGNITINPKLLILDHSSIVAQAIEGQGGNIAIVADHIIRDPSSLIDATSERGVSGTVRSGPEADLAGTIAVPTPDFLDASSLLAETCPGRSGQPRSGLAQGGRGGLPADPTRPHHVTLIADRMPEDRQSMGMGENAGVSEARVPAPTEADPAWVVADRTKRSILCGP